MPEGSIKRFFGHNVVVIYTLVAIVYAVITIYVTDLTPVEAFLQSFLFWCAGWFLAVAFFMHWIQPSADRIAEGIGSPFQKEVAAADGAFGILGITCGFISPSDFWTATAIGASFMLFMMGVGHVIDLVKNKNRSPLNAGATMYFGLPVPIVIITLLILWKAGV